MKKDEPGKSIVLKNGQGRKYECGTMTAIFKADEEETKEVDLDAIPPDWVKNERSAFEVVAAGGRIWVEEPRH